MNTEYLKEEREKAFTLIVILSFVCILAAIYFDASLLGLSTAILAVWAGYYGRKLGHIGKLKEIVKKDENS